MQHLLDVRYMLHDIGPKNKIELGRTKRYIGNIANPKMEVGITVMPLAVPDRFGAHIYPFDPVGLAFSQQVMAAVASATARIQNHLARRKSCSKVINREMRDVAIVWVFWIDTLATLADP
jgi:hypothetical protein